MWGENTATTKKQQQTNRPIGWLLFHFQHDARSRIPLSTGRLLQIGEASGRAQGAEAGVGARARLQSGGGTTRWVLHLYGAPYFYSTDIQCTYFTLGV